MIRPRVSSESTERSSHILRRSSSIALATLLLSSTVVGLALAQVDLQRRPPETRREEVIENLHGVNVVDPYRWLEDQDSPETRAWIDAQNEYTHSFIDKLKGREAIKERLAQLMKTERISMPIERNGRYFFTRRGADQDLYVIYMRKRLEGRDRVLIDPHTMSADKTKSVDILGASKDGKLLVYEVRDGGEDEVTVKLFDVDKRRELPDSLPKALYFSMSMRPDKRGFYYSRHGEEGSRIYYHKLGSDPAGDVMIFGEGYGPDKGIGVDVSEDGRFLFFVIFYGSAEQKTDIFYQDLVKKGPILPLVTDIDARFTPQVGGDTVFMLTNWDAPNGRVLAVDLNNPARENWKEIIPEAAAVVEGMSIAGGKLFLNYLENVVSKVKVFEPDGRYVRQISFPTLGYVGGVAGQWKRSEAFYLFTSFHVPTTIYRYDISKGTQEIWAQLKVPVDTDKIQVEQVWYVSKDGTKVPMFLVHGKGLELNGNNPVLLTGYGGFNVSMTPYFSSTGVLLAENGGVLAIPNLRGGAEFGEEWHRAGMFERKQNVFDDFIAASEWLIAHKYTNVSRLAIDGGSNGGLLVGAAMVQRPELFRAVVCTYPLLDMLRYHQFLLGKFWISEYGSADDPEQFTYLHAYSPYHNVKRNEKYPATLFVTGDSDTRVAPLHARKMAALLQYATGSDRPVLLLYDTKLGHSGGRPVSRLIEDLANELGFVFWQLGMMD